MNNALYVFGGGLLFAVLQFSYFAFLEWQLSSAWTTYMLVTLAWLAGSALGLRLPMEIGMDWKLLMLNLSAYYALCLGLHLRPYDNRFLPLYGLLVACSGAHAGFFFRSNFKLMKSARHLLLHENNGFILGLIAGFFGYFGYGQLFLFVAPATSGILLFSIRLFSDDGCNS